MGFHGVLPRSLWVLIAPNPGEIRSLMLRVKSWVTTAAICAPNFKVIEELVYLDGEWPFLHRVNFAKTCTFLTESLTKFVGVKVLLLTQHIPNQLSLPADDQRQHFRPRFSSGKHFHRTWVPVSLLVCFWICRQLSLFSESSRFIIICVSCLLCSSTIEITTMKLISLNIKLKYREKICFSFQKPSQFKM